MERRPQIGFFEMDNHSALVKERLERLADVRLFRNTLDHHLDEAVDMDIISVFIRSEVTSQILHRLPALKLLASRSTGVDHIDVQAAADQGVVVTNVPIYGENTVAEHTFALILALSRNIHRAYVRTARSDFSWEGLSGFDLKGKTIGVVGAGHIGLYVIKMAKGFGMNVLAYDVKTNPFHADVLGFTYADMDTLLQRSDIVTLHAPYTTATHHMIDKETLSLMKPGALLINTARGGLVDTQALMWALDQGIIGGAGLDVLEGEELITEEAEILTREFSREALASLVRSHVLLRRENVVITPHIAFNSREAVRRIFETTARNIEAFIEGRPENVVEPPAARKAA